MPSLRILPWAASVRTLSPTEMQKIRTALDTIQLGNIGTARVDSIHLFKSDLTPQRINLHKIILRTINQTMR